MINSTFEDIFYNKANTRMRAKFLMDSPFGIILIYSMNVIVNLYLVPKVMKNRKPSNFVNMWHFCCVLVALRSLYFICIGIKYYFLRYSHQNFEELRCLIINDSDSVEVDMCWTFLMSWFIYVPQNFAYSFSKKGGEAATYMIVHHTAFPIIVWIVIRYYPGGHVRMIRKIQKIMN
jgi:hypothetical protein